MYKILLFLITLNVSGQNDCNGTNGDLTLLNEVPSTWTVGNPCGEPNFIDGHIYGDLILKGDCFIWNARLTVHGYIIYNGFTIGLTCSNSELIETGSLGIDDLNRKDILAYPNPTDGIVNININEIFEVEVYDVLGRLVAESLDLGELPRGVYIIKIITFYSEDVIKVIKR